MSDILIAFATKNGSTEEVAIAIAGTLHEGGHAVDLVRARTQRESVARWGLVVLGAPIYSGRWHRDAHWFLKRHRQEFAQIPAAVFGMGPRSGTDEGWQQSREQLARALRKRSWFAPVATAVFGGVDPPTRRHRERRDLRDWEAIHAWAEALAVLVFHDSPAEAIPMRGFEAH